MSGLEASKFTISSAGALSFASSQDYESPADNGGNAVYNVSVGVSDDSISSNVALVITVAIAWVMRPKVPEQPDFGTNDFDNFERFIIRNSNKIITYDQAVKKINDNLFYKLINILTKKTVQIKRIIKK